MSFLPYVLLGAYVVAINLYQLFFIKGLANARDSKAESVKFAHTKILLAGLFGGALLGYLSLFFFKYNTSNLLLMILLPLMIVGNVYLVIWLVRGSMVLFAG